jgi:hypothetical protein
MITYDLYLFAKEGGVVVGWHRFDALQDSDALEIADRLVSQPPAELWRDDSLVKQWDGKAE